MNHDLERVEPSRQGPPSGGGVGLRLFAALRVDRQHAAIIADFAEALAGGTQGVQPLSAEQLHVAWAFLGAVSEELVPAVVSTFDDAALSIPGPIQCSTAGLASMAAGRTLALDIDVDLLAVLGAARDHFLDVVAPYAPGCDRRAWRPHVPILRSATAHPLAPRLLASEGRAAPAVRWVVPEIGLYVSLPGPGGYQHRLLHAVPFGAVVHQR